MMWEYFEEKVDVGHSKDFNDDGSDVLRYVEKLNVFHFFSQENKTNSVFIIYHGLKRKFSKEKRYDALFRVESNILHTVKLSTAQWEKKVILFSSKT